MNHSRLSVESQQKNIVVETSCGVSLLLLFSKVIFFLIYFHFRLIFSEDKTTDGIGNQEKKEGVTCRKRLQVVIEPN